MQCERAQEFFSDYLETTLDRPMAVALETHLSACPACREEYAGLRAAWQSLNTLPAIEPPAGGPERVLMRLRELDAAPRELVAPRRQSFLEFLRSLSPARVAFGTALATMVVAGAILVPSLGETRLGPWLPFLRSQTPAASQAPSLQVSYGLLTPEGQAVTLRFVPAAEMAVGQVRIVGSGVDQTWPMNVRLSPERPLDIPVRVPARAGSAQSVRLTVEAQASGQAFSYLVVLPLSGTRATTVSDSFFEQPLDAALLRVAAHLDRPVVVEGTGEGVTRLTAEGLPALRALESVAAEAGYQVRVDAGAYRLTPVR